MGRLKKAEIDSYVFKGIGLNTYPVIGFRNPDLKSFCQTTKNQLSAVGSEKFIDIKNLATWEMIDPREYVKEEE